TTPDRAAAKAACAAYSAGSRGCGLSEQSTPSVCSLPLYGPSAFATAPSATVASEPAPFGRTPASRSIAPRSIASRVGIAIAAGAAPPLDTVQNVWSTAARSGHPRARSGNPGVGFGIGRALYNPRMVSLTVNALVTVL